MATSSTMPGSVRIYPAEGTPGAGNVMILTDDVSRYDTFSFLFTAGSFTVECSIDGTDWSGPVSLEDKGATSLTLVTTGVNNRWYDFRRKVPYIRVKQSGGTALVGKMCCGNLIGA